MPTIPTATLFFNMLWPMLGLIAALASLSFLSPIAAWLAVLLH
jgi:hypothetical protein